MTCRKTAEFIQAHADDDIRTLALKAGGREDIDLPFALDQIAGRQTARRKLPSWAATEGITYPPHISMEQCSSEQTARYKADVARRIAGGGLLIDITGGFGVDFSFMARAFDTAVYVERQEHLCAIAQKNLALLGAANCRIVNGDGVDHVRTTNVHASMIYADPARRNGNGGRTYAIGDCTPDMTEVMDTLLDKTDHVMIKLSPMLDWHKAVSDIGRNVREVHIVSAANECKELLLVISRECDRPLTVFCADDDNVISYTPETGRLTPAESPTHTDAHPQSENGDGTEDKTEPSRAPLFLYEPNASIMKAGCFALVGRRYGVRQISKDSPLFISDKPADNFPGREFTVEAMTGMNKKELKKTLGTVTQANIATRNFPLSVAELRRRLRLKDGGDTYIFATTTADRKHILFICKRKTT